MSTDMLRRLTNRRFIIITPFLDIQYIDRAYFCIRQRRARVSLRPFTDTASTTHVVVVVVVVRTLFVWSQDVCMPLRHELSANRFRARVCVTTAASVSVTVWLRK